MFTHGFTLNWNKLLKCKQFLLLSNSCDIQRAMSTELNNALRPFYFAVHPDLFGQHPKQRSINEDSLKQLSAHMQSLYEHKYQDLLINKTLQFYIRDGNASSRDTFRLIKIRLDKQMRDPKSIIQTLLELCNLPTDYLKSIKSTPLPKMSSSSHTSSATGGGGFQAGQNYNYGSDDFMDFEYNYYKAKKENSTTLDAWIVENAKLARSRNDDLTELKSEVDKLQKAVVKRLGLLDARYDCGWNFEHYRGCLKTLERMADLHEKHMGALRGRIVVFAPFTGVSLEGHVMLFTGDVLTNWIEFIKNIPSHDAFLKKVPLYENTLSQVLRNIKIGRRKFMPKQQAVEYADHLTKVTTTLGDYLTTNKYPKSWPESLADYEIVIESEAGPLMVNPTGQFIAPATCPGIILIDFITTNLQLTKERIAQYKEQKSIEIDLVERCIGEMQLKSLTKDDSVTPDRMIKALTSILTHEFTPFRNIDLHITNYYSVSGDGIVCIPWDFMDR